MNIWLRTNGHKKNNSSSISPLNTSLPTITEHRLKNQSQDQETSNYGSQRMYKDRSDPSSQSLCFLKNQVKEQIRSSSIMHPKILNKQTGMRNEGYEAKTSNKIDTNKSLRSVRFQLDEDSQIQPSKKGSKYSKYPQNYPLKPNYTQKSRYDYSQTNENLSEMQNYNQNENLFQQFEFIKFKNMNATAKTKTMEPIAHSIYQDQQQQNRQQIEQIKQSQIFYHDSNVRGYNEEFQNGEQNVTKSIMSSRFGRFIENSKAQSLKRESSNVKAKVSNESSSRRGEIIKSIKNSEKIASSYRNKSGQVNSNGIVNTKYAQNNDESWNLTSKRSVDLRTSAVKTTGRKQNIKEHIISIIQHCSNEVGIAIYNTTNGQIFLCQIIERLTYFRTLSTIQRFYPLQIIYSSSLQHTPLIKKLIKKFKTSIFRNFKRIVFDETKGYLIYSQRGNKQEYNPDNKFIAYSALNALVFYLQNNFQTKFNYASLKIKWHLIEDLLVIESQTISALQIFLNAETKQQEDCFINNFSCLTYGGMRMLRANILQPLSNQKAIRERQNLVQYLLQDKVLYDILSAQIAKFKNFQLITAKFIQTPKENNIKSLKTYLAAIYSLSNMCFLLKKFHHKISVFIDKKIPLISKLFTLVNDIKVIQLRQNIESNFDEQILKTYETTKISRKQNFIFLFKVQKMDDDFIEVIRITYSHTYEDILRIFKSIKEKSGSELKLLYNQYRGYYIKTTKKINLSDLSQKIEDDIILINQKKEFILFSTSILLSLNNRLKESQKKLILLSQKLLMSIIADIQRNMDILFDINYQMSVIDMIISFVNFTKKYHTVKFVKPIIQKDKDQIIVEKLRTIWTDQRKFKVSNEINITMKANKKVLVYQKQHNSYGQMNILYSVGYLIILTQIGCFVPASHFVTDIYHTLLSKIKLTQSIQNNLSHFQIQLHHFKNILDNSNQNGSKSKSLILINELIKGTQYHQQLSLSMALMNRLTKLKGKSIVLVSDKYQLKIIKKMIEQPKFLYLQEDEEEGDQSVSKQIYLSQNNKKDYQSPISICQTTIQISLYEALANLNFSEEFIDNFKKISYRQSKRPLFT